MTTAGADADGVYASGIIPEVVETGGECTLTAVGAGGSLTASRAAEAATASTNCGLLRIAASSGDWSLTLTYTSSTSHGSTAEVPVSVP